MKKRYLFLRWNLLACLSLVAATVIWKLGWFEAMYAEDQSKLTVITLAFYAYASLRASAVNWRVSSAQDRPMDAAARTDFLTEREIDLRRGDKSGRLCEKLGFLGTVVGLIMSVDYGRLTAVDASDAAAMKAILLRLALGMLTAFITTAVGIVCRLLLEWQYDEVEYALVRISARKEPS